MYTYQVDMVFCTIPYSAFWTRIRIRAPSFMHCRYQIALTILWTLCCTPQTIEEELITYSRTGLWSIGRESEDKIEYLATRNHTECVGLLNPALSERDPKLGNLDFGFGFYGRMLTIYLRVFQIHLLLVTQSTSLIPISLCAPHWLPLPM